MKQRLPRLILFRGRPVMVFCLSVLCLSAQADSIAMSDYILLSRGMTEAEVLYRVGPPDHESVASDSFNNILNKTWYYIPGGSEASTRSWITEIVFSGSGKIRSLDRYKP